MRCHRVTVKKADGTAVTRYAATAALARAVRDELAVQAGVSKRQGEIEQAEIPTAKDGLLEFVNGLLAGSE